MGKENPTYWWVGERSNAMRWRGACRRYQACWIHMSERGSLRVSSTRQGSTGGERESRVSRVFLMVPFQGSLPAIGLGSKRNLLGSRF